jgi:putative lipase involved disintegration of autophagic bodies
MKTLILICLITANFGLTNFVSAQKLSNEDLNKVHQLIEVKHKLENNNELKSTYKIQIFSGALNQAEEILDEFKSLELDINSKIVYQTPYYKVWLGNYRNRIQADRAFEKLKSEYPNALIIRPGR